jgi:serine/threonine protein phosphatase PrpC
LIVRRSARAAAAASDDHKPDRDDEMRRIADAGGFVSDADAARSGAQHVVARLDGNLAVSRGLGDFAYKKDPRLGPGSQKVSCVPECYDVGLGGSSEPLAAGDLLILACDGIFDVMSNEQLVAAVVDALDAGADVGDVCARVVSSCLPGREKGAKFPTSKAPLSVVFHSFRLIFGRAIISRKSLEAWTLFLRRARAEHSR